MSSLFTWTLREIATRRQQRGVHLLALGGLLLAPTLAMPTWAQCPTVCGDLTGNGFVTSSDFILLLDFLHSDSALTVDLECADIDDYDLINIGDVQQLLEYLFFGSTAPVCTSGHGRIIPTPSLDVRIEHTSLVPANVSNLSVLFRLHTSFPVSAVNLSVQLSVAGEAPTVDSVLVEMDWSRGIANAEPAGAPAGTLTAAFYEPTGTQLGERDLITAYVSIAPSSSPRFLSVDHVELPPLMEDEFGVLTLLNSTLVLQPGFGFVGSGAWAPAAPVCAIWNTGDVNLDLDLTSSDVIHVVNYVFKGGFAPYPCPASADVNCSGAITSADIITLVNHVFKGGPAPCDVCALIPGTWSCTLP